LIKKKNELSGIIKRSFIYLLSGVVKKTIPFMLLPVLTPYPEFK